MRGLISFVIVAVTVVFQLTVVDRIAFPGGSGPDLVLLAVAALALASGPMAGALTGFWAGLALDVAPPGSHFVGQDALVFCLIGYACGLLADDSSGDGATEPGHTALFEITVTAAGAICGEALAALLGVMLSDPRVTWPAITDVLPAAVAYDVLLCPFALYAVAAVLRLAGARREGRRVGWSQARAGSPGLGSGLGTGLGAVRQVDGGHSPRLRLADRGHGGRAQGPVGGRRGPGASGRPMAKREPHLKLGRGGSLAFGGSARVGTAFAAGGRGGPAKVRFARSSLGRSWLGGSVFSRSSSSAALSSSPGRSPLSGRAPRFSRPSALARLPGALRRPALRRPALRRPALRRRALRRPALRTPALGRPALGRSPGKGWLRRRSARRTSLGRGWGSASQLRLRSGLGAPRAPARLRMPRQRAKRGWRTAGRRRRTGGYL